MPQEERPLELLSYGSTRHVGTVFTILLHYSIMQHPVEVFMQKFYINILYSGYLALCGQGQILIKV